MPKTEDILQASGQSEMVDYGLIPHPPPIREWRVLVVLMGIQFIFILDYIIVMPMAPQLMRLFEITPQQLGVLISAYMFSAGVFGFLAAFFIDHFDRKLTAVVICGGFSAAMLLCALAYDYESLLAARVAAGAFGGVMNAIVFSIIADLIPASRRGAATGTVMSSFPLASVIGVPLCLFLVGLFSWRISFFLLAIMGLLVVISCLRILPSMCDHFAHHLEKNPIRQFKRIFSETSNLVAVILIAVLMFAGSTVIPFIAVYMVSNVGMREAELPYLYFFGGLLTFFTAILIGRLADHYDKRKLFYVVAVLSIVPILWVTHLSRVSLPHMLVVTTLFMILVTGRFIPVMALITINVAPQLRGSFMSLISSAQQISAGLASLVAGSIIGLSAAGEMTNFGIVGIVSSLATILCIFLMIKFHAVEH